MWGFSLMSDKTFFAMEYTFFKTRTVGLIHERKKERNVLFNDALNTFYLRLYGVTHM